MREEDAVRGFEGDPHLPAIGGDAVTEVIDLATLCDAVLAGHWIGLPSRTKSANKRGPNMLTKFALGVKF